MTAARLLRIEAMFRQAFGRELTSDERKFLGFSLEGDPIAEISLAAAAGASADSPSDFSSGDSGKCDPNKVA